MPSEARRVRGRPRYRGVDGWVLRDANLRIPSGPEGSSGKQALAGAAGMPGRSRRSGERPSPSLVNGGCTVTTLPRHTGAVGWRPESETELADDKQDKQVKPDTQYQSLYRKYRPQVPE